MSKSLDNEDIKAAAALKKFHQEIKKKVKDPTLEAKISICISLIGASDELINGLKLRSAAALWANASQAKGKKEDDMLKLFNAQLTEAAKTKKISDMDQINLLTWSKKELKHLRTYTSRIEKSLIFNKLRADEKQEEMGGLDDDADEIYTLVFKDTKYPISKRSAKMIGVFYSALEGGGFKESKVELKEGFKEGYNLMYDYIKHCDLNGEELPAPRQPLDKNSTLEGILGSDYAIINGPISKSENFMECLTNMILTVHYLDMPVLAKKLHAYFAFYLRKVGPVENMMEELKKNSSWVTSPTSPTSSTSSIAVPPETFIIPTNK